MERQRQATHVLGGLNTKRRLQQNVPCKLWPEYYNVLSAQWTLQQQYGDPDTEIAAKLLSTSLSFLLFFSASWLTCSYTDHALHIGPFRSSDGGYSFQTFRGKRIKALSLNLWSNDKSIKCQMWIPFCDFCQRKNARLEKSQLLSECGLAAHETLCGGSGEHSELKKTIAD